MSLFTIQIKAGKPAVFAPASLTANVNDSVYWHNGDQVAHWPAPSAADPKAWMDYEIAPDGESDQISMNPPGPYTLNYICTLHPGEKGQIKVLGGKKVAFGGTTKGGAFAKKTKTGALAKKTKAGALAKKTKQGALAKNTKAGALATKTKKGAYGRNTR